MSSKESATPNSLECATALEYLVQADEEMAAGNGREAAGLLWKATQATLLELARERGLTLNGAEYDDFMDVADALDSGRLAEKHNLRSNFIAATVLRDHAGMDVLDGPELDFSYEVTRKFIVDCSGESD